MVEVGAWQASTVGGPSGAAWPAQVHIPCFGRLQAGANPLKGPPAHLPPLDGLPLPGDAVVETAIQVVPTGDRRGVRVQLE